jgi:hypothetical protein
MYTKNTDYNNKFAFFDATVAWTSEVNKDPALKASSCEVIAAYHHLDSAGSNFIFKNDDGTWNKTLPFSEKKEMVRIILWLRARVIM